MTVIPFVIDGNNKTVVETKEDFDTAGGLYGNVILIRNIDRNQVDKAKITEDKSSKVSYDLRVGNEYRDHRDLGKTDLPDGGMIHLPPGTAVIIETYEEVHFPRSRFGHIVPKVKLLMDGISNTSSKIDPGFDGKLLITVFNLGNKKITLKKHDKFCTLYTLNVQEEGLISRDKERPRMPGSQGSRFLTGLRSYVEKNQALLSGINIFATIILAFATTALLVIQIRQETNSDNSRGETKPLSLKSEASSYYF